MSSDTIIIDVKELVAAEEKAARHLFVVCGQPSTDEGFHQAWFKEDPVWFAKWMVLKATADALKRVEVTFG